MSLLLLSLDFSNLCLLPWCFFLSFVLFCFPPQKEGCEAISLISPQNQQHSPDFTVLKNLVWFSDVTGVICTRMLRLAICSETTQKDPPVRSLAAHQPAHACSWYFPELHTYAAVFEAILQGIMESFARTRSLSIA